MPCTLHNIYRLTRLPANVYYNKFCEADMLQCTAQNYSVYCLNETVLSVN